MIWLLSLLSAVCFWAGGRSWGNKLIRRLGCPILALVGLWLGGCMRSFNLGVPTLFFALNFGAMSTYHDYLGPISYLPPHGETFREETLACWIMTGLCYGLAAIPLIWLGVGWFSILIRTVTLAVAIPLIRKIPNAHPQEALSGFVYLATLKIII